MKTKVKNSTYFAHKLINGGFRVDGFIGEFSKPEWEKLKQLIAAENPGCHFITFCDFSNIRS